PNTLDLIPEDTMFRAGHRWLPLGVLTLAPLLLAGCGRTKTTPPRPGPRPVSIRVTWKGEPLRYTIVNLTQVVANEGAEADGCTDDNGVFVPRSFANDGSRDGLVPGKYRLSFEHYDPARLVAFRPLPPDAMGTVLPALEWDPGVEVEYRAGEAELKV